MTARSRRRIGFVEEGVRAARDVVALTDGAVGAYVHVPFCERICPFCPYNKVVAEEGLARRYFAALDREMAWYAEALAEACLLYTSPSPRD